MLYYYGAYDQMQNKNVFFTRETWNSNGRNLLLQSIITVGGTCGPYEWNPNAAKINYRMGGTPEASRFSIYDMREDSEEGIKMQPNRPGFRSIV